MLHLRSVSPGVRSPARLQVALPLTGGPSRSQSGKSDGSDDPELAIADEALHASADSAGYISLESSPSNAHVHRKPRIGDPTPEVRATQEAYVAARQARLAERGTDGAETPDSGVSWAGDEGEDGNERAPRQRQHTMSSDMQEVQDVVDANTTPLKDGRQGRTLSEAGLSSPQGTLLLHAKVRHARAQAAGRPPAFSEEEPLQRSPQRHSPPRRGSPQRVEGERPALPTPIRPPMGDAPFEDCSSPQVRYGGMPLRIVKYLVKQVRRRILRDPYTLKEWVV